MHNLTAQDATFGASILALCIWMGKELWSMFSQQRRDLQAVDDEQLKAIKENTRAILILTGKVEYLENFLEDIGALKKDVTTLRGDIINVSKMIKGNINN